ncbi:hypothetical protein H312_03131 [Anncaliia algerae PRA339]|uniref:Uncharacterized protein n=1 Tax=Anncaliia algerae PRA339 TaxID=1288291 RepID=A0A059EX81_9MICR|nr:hypothetical protein H312_03131 [Anncaliia algerae PRA339]
MFCCKEIIICFLFLLEKITCSVTNDTSYNYNIEKNRKIKENIDKIVDNYIINRDNFLNFKNCIECLILRSKRSFSSANNLSEERKEFLLNSTIEILKRGFNPGKHILYFSEDMDYTEVNPSSENEFYGNFKYTFYFIKSCISKIKNIEKFYRICIEGTKPIIENYILTQSYNKEGMNNCLEEIVKKFNEFLDNDGYKYYIGDIQSDLQEFYILGKHFYNIWTNCSDELKYRLIFGYNCINLKKKEIKFNRTLIRNKIREIEEMYEYIINYLKNLENPDYYIENNQKYTQMMEFIYNTELILYKCKILYRFINENKSYIIKTYHDDGNIIENTVSEKKINEYLYEIELISNKIKNDYLLKCTVNSIWRYLMIMLNVEETILDDFVEKKRKQIQLLCEEGNKIMFDLMAKFFEIDDKTFKNSYVEIFFDSEKSTLFSNIEYDYFYLTPYFFSSDLFSDFSVIILLGKIHYYNSFKYYSKVDIDSNSIFRQKFEIIKREMLDLQLLSLAVNEVEKNLRETQLWFLQNYN